MSFFSSRWVIAPDYVGELNAGSLPGGFVAGGVAAGLKRDGEFDVGVLMCMAPSVTSAARFCDSGVLAAPVVLCQTECDLGALHAVIANSGNANAATGEAGLEQARRVQVGAANALGFEPRQVAVASTGVIGVQLPGEVIADSLMGVAARLDPRKGAEFAAAIRTTDVIDKHAALSVELPSGTIGLSAQAKGAGMISPHFATMLCFVETDAAISSEQADRLLGVALERSFNRISVDGQLSTNDTVILLASGASGIEIAPGSADEQHFAQALDVLMLQLALLMVKDGEGAARVGRIRVSGGDEADTDAVARAIANSPLVKAALYGGDPNWGRIAQAVGATLRGAAPLSFDIRVEGIPVCTAGAAVDHDAANLGHAVQRDEVEYEVELPGTGSLAEYFFSDLSYGYVKINAEYTT
ncbi:MAG TPA: bifunctional glutamate N-acetyltransferase/amino-acid acetyltransferase ArgJ [Solirubrobacteraceae bacterium]|nr:bifunctional glutamate N-acetyltransferase/amino-acid acetyltransferase ArgJ [Solirubrobacteraceae bacterium]